MNTLLIFLIRRDQVTQLMAYLLIGTLLIALEMGVARPDAAGDETVAPNKIAVVEGSAGTLARPTGR